jgi:hypothetical protein
VKNNVNAILNSKAEHSIAIACLSVRDVASPAAVGSEVALALRPLERSLAEAVGKVAHNLAINLAWLNKDGPRAEFMRGCEVQFGKVMTPRLRSRMLFAYHKLYGSKENANGALFTSKSHQHTLRKGFPRKKRPKRTGEANKQKETPHEVVLQAAASKRTRQKKKNTGVPVAPPKKDEEQDTALPMALVQMPQIATIENGNFDCVYARYGMTGIEYVGVAQHGPYQQQHDWWYIW